MRPLGLAALFFACSTPAPQPSSATAPVIDFEGRFFDAPYPSPGRLRADGTIDVGDFPGPTIALKQRLVDQLGTHGEGFGRSTAMWLRFTDAIDPSSLPQLGVAPTLDDSVFLIDLESNALVPLELKFKAEQETYSPRNLLVATPFQGHVPAAGTWHALVVTTKLKGADGLPVPRAAFLDQASGGGARADALRAELPRLKTALGDRYGSVAAATVFRTGSHWERLQKIATTARAFPAAAVGPVTKLREHPGFAVFEGELDVPMYQHGDEPYSEDGAMVFDATGAPVQQRVERIRFALAVPRRAMPAGGFPLLFHVPGSGGSHLAIIDRGANLGRGLAEVLAPRGIAAIGIEANLTGPRAPGGSGNGDIFYNVFNPVALRDNHRQQVAEYEVLATLAKGLTVDGAQVAEAGAASIRFDGSRFFVHGHSTGSVVGASVVSSNESFRAAALSGAGGSWLYNLVLKQTPASAELVKPLLGYTDADAVDIFDPVLTLAATMWEPIEPMNQAPGWVRDLRARTTPISVLLVEGIVDTYYLPRMVNALAMSARVDVAAPALDPDTVTELAQVGTGPRATPFSANSGGSTLGLVQYPALPNQDGHFVVFNRPETRVQYACFFASAASGQAVVVAADAGCP
ncbi:MAG: hypothetical protein JNK82_44900 [Myxococcaceae bacterium]|nr:hypothetical protein [Myxococcaceae bacterium]